MPIDLDMRAVQVFRQMIDQNHDNRITPYEAAQGINDRILSVIAQSFPGMERYQVNPEYLGNFMNEDDGTIGDAQLKMLLEQYFEYLAREMNNPQILIAFQNEFNRLQEFINPEVNADVEQADAEQDDEE